MSETLAERLAHMRVIGAGWCGEATYELLIDVAIAAEHLQSIDRELHTSGSSEFWSALADMYERLDALTAHVRGNAGVRQ